MVSGMKIERRGCVVLHRGVLAARPSLGITKTRSLVSTQQDTRKLR